MKKVIVTGQEAKKRLKSGIDKVADAVKLTLGPSGRNAIIGRPYQNPLLTNDGISIAKEYILDDEIEELGAQTVRDAAKSANDNAGDGTTTTTVLVQAITNTAFKRLETKDIFTQSSTDPMVVRKEINEACKKAVELLKSKARPLKTIEDIAKVATISVESADLGGKIATMFDELGKDAVITTVDGANFNVEFETIKGVEINAGLSSPHFANTTKGEYLHDHPAVLVTNVFVEAPEQLKGIMTKLVEQGKRTLVIVGDNFSKEILTSFAITHIQGGVTVIAVKAPVFNDREQLIDYATILGAKFIERDVEKIQEAELKDLGSAEKIIVSKDKTVFIGGNGDVEERIQQLETQVSESTSLFDKDNLKKRIGKLSGGVGIIRVGAESETEREYLKLKIEDAVNATRSAMEEGVVKGGGFTLNEIAGEMEDNILTEALKTPYNQIQKNAGGELEITDDVLDPVKVTRTALEKACSVAGTVITCEIAIADKKEEKKDRSLDD